MRARDVVLFAVAVIAVVTVINLLTGNKRITSTLPISRLEHARQESLSKPFHLRAHRLERSARLEGQLLATSWHCSHIQDTFEALNNARDSCGLEVSFLWEK